VFAASAQGHAHVGKGSPGAWRPVFSEQGLVAETSQTEIICWSFGLQSLFFAN
jgi:hypothetical protein